MVDDTWSSLVRNSAAILYVSTSFEHLKYDGTDVGMQLMELNEKNVSESLNFFPGETKKVKVKMDTFLDLNLKR